MIIQEVPISQKVSFLHVMEDSASFRVTSTYACNVTESNFVRYSVWFMVLKL